MIDTTSRRGPRTAGALCVLLTVLMAIPASAQEADRRLARIRDGLPPAALEQVEASLAEARTQGLPVEPLLDKAVEGLAKNVPGDRVAGAVGVLLREMANARGLLSDGVPPTPTDVAAVADALRRGVPGAAVRRLSEGRRAGEPVAMAVHTLGDLLDQGVPLDQAFSVIDAWRERGSRPDDLRELPAAIERLIRQGVLPEQAAAAVAGSMRAGGPPGGPPGLQGNRPGVGRGGNPPIPPGAGPPTERGRKPQRKPPGGGPPGGG